MTNRRQAWMRRLAGLRAAAGGSAIDGFYRGLSQLGRLSPQASPSKHGVMVVSDVPYHMDGHPRHNLDVYVPRRLPPPRPAVLYLHGGGFRILSKESHWAMALAFARQGFVVFNVGYRLAPADSFPAAIEDACAAYTWVVKHAKRWGGDPTRLVVAGESAGANLATALSVAACFERPEPYAKSVFNSGVVPRVALPACGFLQVSQPERFLRNEALMPFVADRILAVSHGYLPNTEVDPDTYAMADPLRVLESSAIPARPLPAFFAVVGQQDPVADDTLRLEAALRKRGVPGAARVYPRQGHAFHAYMWRPEAKQAWRDTFAFLDQHLPTQTNPSS
ncbi:MAG: alpha/beta hydrolase [Myxococcota bacterium]